MSTVTLLLPYFHLSSRAGQRVHLYDSNSEYAPIATKPFVHFKGSLITNVNVEIVVAAIVGM